MISTMSIIEILLTTIIAFSAGGVWYSKFLFGRTWLKESNVTFEKKRGPSAIVYIASFMFMLVSATTFGILCSAHPGLETSLQMAVMISVCFVTTALGINYLYSGKSVKLLLVDSGYHILQFVIYGIIYGFWPVMI